jgi:RimJ/RimL family protein N-acetyltransferase/uncharacterized glyoxalase superfamily protein PhnB
MAVYRGRSTHAFDCRGRYREVPDDAPMTKLIPRGWHSVTPRLVVSDAARLVDFLRQAYGATGDVRTESPSMILIGDSLVMVSTVGPRDAMPAFLYLYVDDIDATYGRALKAGAVSIEEPQDTPYGDRRGMVKDPCGNIWQIATHRDEISQDGIRPIGPEVPAHVARRPERRVLQGRIVRLEPLDPASHGASLWRETHGSRADAFWQYLFETPFPDETAFLAHLALKAVSEDPLYFGIVDQMSGLALGYATLMRIDPVHRCIEVGNILYGAGIQRRPGGTEAQFLLMRHVFDDLGYRRFEWKCNALNAPSRRAAERFGFAFEGIFRQHMIVKGRNRDTAWYSMIDGEWPNVKQALERWLAPENFDAAGRQRQNLESIRIALSAGITSESER